MEVKMEVEKGSKKGSLPASEAGLTPYLTSFYNSLNQKVITPILTSFFIKKRCSIPTAKPQSCCC